MDVKQTAKFTELFPIIPPLPPSLLSFLAGGHPVLRKTWVCRDFKEATNMITEIRRIADRENHHPVRPSLPPSLA